MAYSLEDSKLRIVRQICTDKANLLRKIRLIVLEHILPTTEEFIQHLKAAGAEIFELLAKPYSIDQAVATRLAATGTSITNKSYSELENTPYLDELLHKAAQQSIADGKKIVVIDVGGYFAQPITRMKENDRKHLLGVVEDTTFGHNRYLALVESIEVPIFSAARSALKEIEARFVGRDAVAALDDILRREGVSLPGRNALVIGYGMIGKSVARALKANDLNVLVYDKLDYQILAAFMDGFHVHTKKELIKKAHVIFSATGDPNGAMSLRDIEDSCDNVILASVGSKDTEFDVETLERRADRKEPIGKDLVSSKLPNSKCVFLARKGTAINFLLPSIPVEVLDLVFSEILSCVVALLENPENFRPKEIMYEADDTILSNISKAWLRNVNG